MRLMLVLVASLAFGGDGTSTVPPPADASTDTDTVTIEDTAALEARLDAQIAVVDELIAQVASSNELPLIGPVLFAPAPRPGCTCPPPPMLIRPPVPVSVNLDRAKPLRPIRTVERGPTP